MQSLIRREGHLIVVDDGRQAAAEGEGRPSRDDRILAVAPNYVIDWYANGSTSEKLQDLSTVHKLSQAGQHEGYMDKIFMASKLESEAYYCWKSVMKKSWRKGIGNTSQRLMCML